MTTYRAAVNAAVAFARNDATFQSYVAAGWMIAAQTYLADRFGTWVAYDARKEMGLTS